jgi:uncharacterized membrane protein
LAAAVAAAVAVVVEVAVVVLAVAAAVVVAAAVAAVAAVVVEVVVGAECSHQNFLQIHHRNLILLLRLLLRNRLMTHLLLALDRAVGGH